MTRYEQGFIQKCAEYGVDGFTMLKEAGLRQYFAKLLLHAKQARNAGKLIRGATNSAGLSRKAINSEIPILETYLRQKGFDPSILGFSNQLSWGANPGRSNLFGKTILVPHTKGTGSGTLHMFVPKNPKSKVGKASMLLQDRYRTRNWRDAISHIYMPEEQRALIESGDPRAIGHVDYSKLFKNLTE